MYSTARLLVAAAALTMAVPTGAIANDAPEVCILTTTVSRTAPKKPDIVETELDCGKAPTEMQDRTSREVHNTMNSADALTLMAGKGFEIETSTVYESFTGRQSFASWTLVRGAGVDPTKENDDILDSYPMSMDELPEDDMMPDDTSVDDMMSDDDMVTDDDDVDMGDYEDGAGEELDIED